MYRDPIRALVLTWIASGLAFLPAFASPEVSRTALALVPWLVWAGWPAEGGLVAHRPPFLRRTLPAIGLAAPLVVFGLELDRASGWPLPELHRTVVMGAGLGLVSAAACARAAWAGGRGSAFYACIWSLAFVLLPVFAALVEFGSEAPGGWIGLAGSASPIGWGLARVTPPVPGDADNGHASLALALFTWIAVSVLGRREKA